MEMKTNLGDRADMFAVAEPLESRARQSVRLLRELILDFDVSNKIEDSVLASYTKG